MARTNPNPPLDRDGLHRLWWRKAGRTGQLKIVQTEWAELLDVTNSTLSRIMKEFAEQGRIRKIGWCLYAIADPDEHGAGPQPSTSSGESDPPAPRRPMWG